MRNEVMRNKVTFEEIAAAITVGLLLLAAVVLTPGCTVLRSVWSKIDATVDKALTTSEAATTNAVDTAKEVVK